MCILKKKKEKRRQKRDRVEEKTKTKADTSCKLAPKGQEQVTNSVLYSFTNAHKPTAQSLESGLSLFQLNEIPRNQTQWSSTGLFCI